MTEARRLRIWAFAISPYGLGLSDVDFQACTPRTYCHLRERWKDSRLFTLHIAAGIQATLHNAHFQHETPFLASMFMPGYKPPQQTLEEKKEMARLVSGGFRTKMTPEETVATNIGAEVFRDRARRAREAQARGEDAAKVHNIMEGIQ